MCHSLYIAWQYLRFHAGKTAVLVAVITLIAYLPLAMQWCLRSSETQMLARAQATPLVIGQKGSALELVLHTLYFTTAPAATLTMAEVERVHDSGLALAIPLYSRFKARGYAVVGTTLDYFPYRRLRLQTGRSLALLGECVLGATVAEALGLRPGDTLMSAPDNLFDLAGSYPLKMQVVGVYEATHTADDLAVFVDLRTAWIIAGLGHGHQDLTTPTDTGEVLTRQSGHVVASAQLQQYTEITAANIDTLHFHGEASQLPLTAIIAVPSDAKSAVLLQGRYHAEAGVLQMVTPSQVVTALLHHIFKLKRLFDAMVVTVSMAMLLALVLIMALSLRLRQHEIDMMYKLGCRRLKIVEIIAAEMCVVVGLSLALTTALAMATMHWQAAFFQRLLALGALAG